MSPQPRDLLISQLGLSYPLLAPDLCPNSAWLRFMPKVVVCRPFFSFFSFQTFGDDPSEALFMDSGVIKGVVQERGGRFPRQPSIENQTPQETLNILKELQTPRNPRAQYNPPAAYLPPAWAFVRPLAGWGFGFSGGWQAATVTPPP